MAELGGCCMKIRIAILFLFLYSSLFTFDLSIVEINGFFEGAGGLRYPSGEDQLILGETRARLNLWSPLGDFSEIQIRYDLNGDFVSDELDPQLRELYFTAYPSLDWEIKAGRQILTWGTGDLLFINDAFPKDYESFFIGRNMEYMKLPSDAIKLSVFPKNLMIDLVLIPIFEPNTYADGERLSYFNQSTGKITGTGESTIDPEEPVSNSSNTELAIRLRKDISGNELALYAYRGFYKSPNLNESGSGYTFSRANIYGASWVGNIFGGIGNAEVGYEDSVEDGSGDKFYIPNSFLKFMLGYKKELLRELTLGVQYYLEQMLDYNDYSDSIPEDFQEYSADKTRGLFAVRLSKSLKKQTVKLGIFSYYSPSDEDGFINPDVSYDFSDHINISCGANMFYGKNAHTFFTQLNENSNVYGRIRYSF